MMKRYFFQALLCSLSVFLFSEPLWSQAVSTIDNQVVTQWDNPITVVPNTMRENNVEFPARTITIHGANANLIYKKWRSEMKGKAREIKGKKPIIARDVMIPALSAAPIQILALPTQERGKQFARLTVAFIANDSTPLNNDAGEREYMRALAVRYNQEVINDVISEKEKELAKAKKKLERSDSNERKTRKRFERAAKKLERAKDRRARAETKKAGERSDLVGLERSLENSRSEKDKKQVIRARRKIADIESDILKYMEKEIDHQQDMDSYNAALPEHARTQVEYTSDVDRLESEIRALRTASERL